MPKPSLRDAIADAAVREFHHHGYAGTGVAGIAAAAHAPKGSFYNHFPSKADVAIEAADRFAAAVAVDVLDDPSVPRAVDRISRLFASMVDQLAGDDFRYGCLLGTFAVDTATDEPRVAEHVDRIFVAWADRLSTTVRLAQDQGDVPADLDAEVVAAAVLDLYEGAALRAKARRDGSGVRAAVTYGIPRLLGR